MQDTANRSHGLEGADPRCQLPGTEREDDGQEPLEPARLRAMLEARDAAAARYRAVKQRLLRRR